MLLLETPSIWESCAVRNSSRRRGRKSTWPVFLYSSLGWNFQDFIRIWTCDFVVVASAILKPSDLFTQGTSQLLVQMFPWKWRMECCMWNKSYMSHIIPKSLIAFLFLQGRVVQFLHQIEQLWLKSRVIPAAGAKPGILTRKRLSYVLTLSFWCRRCLDPPNWRELCTSVPLKVPKYGAIFNWPSKVRITKVITPF